MENFKTCTKCGLIKTFLDFHNDKSKKDGLGSSCKDCTKRRQVLVANSVKPSLFEKLCTKCKIRKSVKSFGKDVYSIDGFTPQCKGCAKKWRVQNPDSIKNSTLKREYGITLTQYKELLIKQNHKCVLCVVISPMPLSGKQLAVDHDHETGRVRGLLCTIHNMALGKLGDTVGKLELVLSYLKGKL